MAFHLYAESNQSANGLLMRLFKDPHHAVMSVKVYRNMQLVLKNKWHPTYFPFSSR